MISGPIFGAIVGFLLGLLLCYYQQIKAAYDKRNLISSGTNVVSSVQSFIGELQKV